MQYPDGEAHSWHPPGAEGPHSSHEARGEPETLGDSEERRHNQTLHNNTVMDGRAVESHLTQTGKSNTLKDTRGTTADLDIFIE